MIAALGDGHVLGIGTAISSTAVTGLGNHCLLYCQRAGGRRSFSVESCVKRRKESVHLWFLWQDDGGTWKRTKGSSTLEAPKPANEKTGESSWQFASPEVR